MAPKVTADPDTRIIAVTEAPIAGLATLDVQKDVYSALKDDWHNTPTLQQLRFPFRSFGDFAGIGKQIGPYVFFDNQAGWRLQPYDVDHELTLEGNLVGEAAVVQLTLGSWLPRAGRTILILDQLSAQALALEGEGLSGADATNLADLTAIHKNKRITDPVTGIETVYEVDDSTPRFTRPIYEDKDGAQAYRGQGLDRVDRHQ
jgi:hypothetical protein